MTNHDIAKSLLVCAEFNPARCADCVVADLRHNRGCFKRLAHMASDRLEALTDQLHYAQAERDVVTKRMIALEIERAGT